MGHEPRGERSETCKKRSYSDGRGRSGTPSIALLARGRACLLHPVPQMVGLAWESRSCPAMAKQAAVSHLAEPEPRTCNWDNLGHNHTTLLPVRTTSFFRYYLEK